jgi:hypothetical protein
MRGATGAQKKHGLKGKRRHDSSSKPARSIAAPDPEQVSQNGVRVSDRAQHQRRDGRVERSVLERKRSAEAVHHRDRHGRGARGLLGTLAEVGLGFDRDKLSHRRGVVPDVDAVPRAELDHAALQPGEHVSAVLRLAKLLLALAQTVEEAGEDWMSDSAHGVARILQVRPPSVERLTVPSGSAA